MAAGAAPQAARKWWLSDMARRANEQAVDLVDLSVTPADVARVQVLVDEGRINDKLARQVFDGVLAGEGRRRVVAARGPRWSPTTVRRPPRSTTRSPANPDVADKIPRRQGRGRRAP